MIKKYVSKSGKIWTYDSDKKLPMEVLTAIKEGRDIPLKYQNRKVLEKDVVEKLEELGYTKEDMQDFGNRIDKADLIKVFDEITPSFWITKLGELIKNLNNQRWSFFVIDQIFFSDGWRELLQGLLKVDVYDNVKYNRYPTDSIYPEDREVKYTEKLHLVVRNDFNEVLRIPYFPNGQAFANWINKQLERTMQTIITAHEYIIEAIFGEDVPLSKIIKDEALSYIQTMINNVRKDIQNIKTLSDTNVSTLIKTLLIDSKESTLLPVWENSIGKVPNPLPIKTSLEDLVIIYNYKHPINFSTEVKAGLFNPYDWPKITKLELRYIPIGKVLLIDKDFFKIAPNFTKYVSSPLFVLTLDRLTGYHSKVFYGTNKYTFGIEYRTPDYNIVLEIANKISATKGQSSKSWEDLSKLTGEISDISLLGLDDITLTDDEKKNVKLMTTKLDVENKELSVLAIVELKDNKISRTILVKAKVDESSYYKKSEEFSQDLIKEMIKEQLLKNSKKNKDLEEDKINEEKEEDKTNKEKEIEKKG